jgi:hypothetical protein
MMLHKHVEVIISQLLGYRKFVIRKFKLFLKTKRKTEIVCALIKDGCNGRTEFRSEFEAFHCDSHNKWAIRKSCNNCDIGEPAGKMRI